MATITALGIGSGLDANSIVDQLMALEQQPLVAMQQKEAGYIAELSAIGQLRSAVSEFKTAVDALKDTSDFSVFAATSADTAKFTASTDSTAAAGTYDIVVQSLAAAQKQGSASFSDSDTTTIGSAGDKLKVTIGTNTFSVEIGGKTLDQIAAAINDASDNVGVTASVIQEDSSNFYLTLTSDNSGLDNVMTLAFEDSGGSPIADPLTMAQIQGASDAQILVDNTYTIKRSTNTISDAIAGVTLTLKETSASAVSLDVVHNSGAVSNSIQNIATAYNTLQTALTALSAGDLSGDSTIRSLQGQIRSILNTPPTGLTGEYKYLSDIGISFTKEGTLSTDTSKLSSALSNSLSSVSELFSDDDQGVAFRLSSLLDNFLGSDGVIDAREDGINARIDSIQETQVDFQFRLGKVEARYRAQYSALDSIMANFSATSSFLDQQLSLLANLTPGNSNN